MIKKIIYIILGSIALALGVTGIILPILPTTPFLLLSAFFYVRSSKKLYHWLINHKLFGKYLYNYLTYKAIPLRAKIFALILIWITIPICCILINKMIVSIILPIIALTVSIYIIRLKTLKKDMSNSSQISEKKEIYNKIYE